MSNKIKYRHYKGEVYTLINNSVICEKTEIRMVVYMDADGIAWSRPHAEFYGYTECGVRRFTPMGEDAV